MPLSGLKFLRWHQNWCHLEPPHLFPVGEAIYQGVFEKTFKNSVAARKSGYCPFTYSMFESHFVTPSLIPSGKGIFLSSFQKNSAHLTHIWKPFCQPIRRGFLLQFLTATFATEKRHDFWKNFPSTLYRNFRSRKTTYFPKLFQKSFLLLYRKFFRANLNCDFEKIPLTYLDWKQNLPTLFSKKNIKNSACLVFRSRRYIFSGIQL